VRVGQDGNGVAAISWPIVDADVRIAAGRALADALGHRVRVVRLRLVDEVGRDIDGGGTLIVGFVTDVLT